MDFQCDSPLEPLRVLIVNSMSSAAKFLAVKILSGEIFGKKQQIDLILMVYTSELPKAMGLKFELDRCAFACTNYIEVSANIPSISDAEVFCFLTNFTNPNTLDFANINGDEKQLEMLDLIINIANNFRGTEEKEQKKEEPAQKHTKLKKNIMLPENKARKPILVCDGLVSMDILKSLSKNLPSDIFFCLTPIPAIAKSALGGHLKVQCKVLNDVLVWAVNDAIFHVEIEKPLIVHARSDEAAPSDWDKIGKDMLASINLDHTQFNPSWLKKDFIEKTLAIAQKNTYGSLYKAAAFAKCLKQIWLPRLSKEKFYTNVGVISDGSLETVKGYPYVLPVILNDDTWIVNTCFENDIHLKQEIKRMNKAIKETHQKLMSFCIELLQGAVTGGSSSFYSAEEASQAESAVFSCMQRYSTNPELSQASIN